MVYVASIDFKGPAGVGLQGMLYWVEGETAALIHETVAPYSSTYFHYTNNTTWQPYPTGCGYMGHTGYFRFQSPKASLSGAPEGTQTYVQDQTTFTVTYWVDGVDPVVTLNATSFGVEAEPTPTPCPEGGGACQLTEAQGADFVNGLQALVILVAIGVPCLVALVTAASLAFFRRG